MEREKAKQISKDMLDESMMNHAFKVVYEAMVALPACMVLIAQQPSWLPHADALSFLGFLAPFHQFFLSFKDFNAMEQLKRTSK